MWYWTACWHHSKYNVHNWKSPQALLTVYNSNNKHTNTRLTSTCHFWRFPSSSVVSLKTGTHRLPTLCAVTVGRTGEAGATCSIGLSITDCRGWEERYRKSQGEKQTDRKTDNIPTHEWPSDDDWNPGLHTHPAPTFTVQTPFCEHVRYGVAPLWGLALSTQFPTTWTGVLAPMIGAIVSGWVIKSEVTAGHT